MVEYESETDRAARESLTYSPSRGLHNKPMDPAKPGVSHEERPSVVNGVTSLTIIWPAGFAAHRPDVGPRNETRRLAEYPRQPQGIYDELAHIL